MSGVMFSGVTPASREDNPYGEWRDCHMPMTDPADPVLKEGLMTEAQVAATMAAVPSTAMLLFAGCKITSLHSGLWIGDKETDDTALRIALNEKLSRYVASLL